MIRFLTSEGKALKAIRARVIVSGMPLERDIDYYYGLNEVANPRKDG